MRNIFSVLFFITMILSSYGQTSFARYSVKYVDYYTPLFKKNEAVYRCSYASAALSKIAIPIQSGLSITKITVVMTLYPADTSKWIIPFSTLVQGRLDSLKKFPGNNDLSTAEIEIILQTKAKTEKEAGNLFHGIVVSYLNALSPATENPDWIQFQTRQPNTAEIIPQCGGLDVNHKIGMLYTDSQNNIWAGLTDGGVLKCDPDNSIFQYADNGLPSENVRDFFTFRGSLYALINTRGLFKLLPDNSWTLINGDIPSSISAISVFKEKMIAAIPGVGLMVSADGKNWKTIQVINRSNNKPVNMGYGQICVSGERIFVSTGPAIYSSDLDLEVWSKVNLGKKPVSVRLFLVDSCYFIVAKQAGGYIFSNDYGKTWTESELKEQSGRPILLNRIYGVPNGALFTTGELGVLHFDFKTKNLDIVLNEYIYTTTKRYNKRYYGSFHGILYIVNEE